MLAKLISLLAGFIIAAISTLGYGGIVLLMAIESACIPLPSEIIMPFAGYLVYRGELDLWLVATAGALGCVLGSLLAYWVGARGGRPLAEKYGRYILVSPHDLHAGGPLVPAPWRHHHPHRPAAAGGAHLHRFSRRRGAHADVQVHPVYLHRLLHLVLGVGMDRCAVWVNAGTPWDPGSTDSIR